MILLQSDYSFTAVTREIDFSGGTFNGIELQQIKVIANVTDDVIIYKFNNPAFGGTLAADVLTLAFDTTSMSDSDVLMIIVETNRDYDQLYQIRQYTSNLDTSLSSVIDGITGISTKTLSDIYDLLDAGIAVTVDTSLLATASKQDAQTALLTTIDGDTSNLDVLLSTRLKPADTLAGVTTVGAVTAITNALPAGNNNIGDVDIASIAAGTNLIGKVSIDQVTANANEVVTKTGSTTVVSSITAALPAGTNAIGKLAANSGVDIGDVDVTSLPALVAGSAIIGKVGIDQTTPGTTDRVTANVDKIGGTAIVTGGTSGSQGMGGIQAHDAADSGNNPVKIGAKANSSEPAAVSTGDIANLITDLVGKLIVLPYANPENFVSGAITSAMTGTTSTSLLAAPAGSLRNYITTIIVSNSHATVGTDIIIQDGNGGTTLMTIPAASVYGGAVITLPTPLRQPTATTALYCANVTTGASTKVSVVGYKGL